MRYYKLVINELFVSVGQGGEQGEEITEAEYNHILSIIKSRPNAPEGFAYRLTAELEWELYELTPMEVEIRAEANLPPDAEICGSGNDMEIT